MILLALLLFTVAQAARPSPPGQPRLTSCRSPEKETFTCRWEPGSDGDLPTTYALFYRKENVDMVYECPDYHTAGENSCFFNKNATSIWVTYNITVVATNALGSNASQPVDVDVVYIVQPHTPENVTVSVLEDAGGPYLRASWEPPHQADTRSGWITLIYELRVKLEGEENWEAHRAGQQKMFNIFSLRSGGSYMVQVRCKPGHGFWSEWSPAVFIQAPDNIALEKSVLILLTTFSIFIFIIFTWILSLKGHSVKHFLLPPVPGPKIKGFDIQLLKDGRSDEMLGALVVHGFPQTSSDCEDLLVEYLEVVYVSQEQEATGPQDQDGYLKPKNSSCDSDSGRGSCDSHTLLMERSGESSARLEDEEAVKREGRQGLGQMQGQSTWESLQGEEGPAMETEVDSPDPPGPDPPGPDGRVKMWPCVFSPLMRRGPPGPSKQCGSPEPSEQRPLDTPSRQICLSDSLFPPPSFFFSSTPSHHPEMRSNPSPPSLPRQQAQNKPSPPSLTRQQAQALRDFDIPSAECKGVGVSSQITPSKSMEYVEVQKVTQQNQLLLCPLRSNSHPSEPHPNEPHPNKPYSSEPHPSEPHPSDPHPSDSHPSEPHPGPRAFQMQLAVSGEDYSKVKGLVSGNVLLLQGQQREAVTNHQGGGEKEAKQPNEDCRTSSSPAQTPKKTAIYTTATPGRKPAMSLAQKAAMSLAPSGYVDTAAMLSSF